MTKERFNVLMEMMGFKVDGDSASVRWGKATYNVTRKDKSVIISSGDRRKTVKLNANYPELKLVDALSKFKLDNGKKCKQTAVLIEDGDDREPAYPFLAKYQDDIDLELLLWGSMIDDIMASEDYYMSRKGRMPKMSDMEVSRECGDLTIQLENTYLRTEV